MMDSSTPIGKFWWAVGCYAHANPHERAGQATFNMLARMRPDLAKQLRGTPDDGFHAQANNDRLDKMCEWIEKEW